MIQLRTLCLSPHLDSFCRKLNEFWGLEFVYADEDNRVQSMLGCLRGLLGLEFSGRQPQATA